MKMRFLPDEPITSSSADILGFSDFVELIQTSIYYTETPFVYGILGDWGTGKTSILRLVEEQLTQDAKPDVPLCMPIWFDAWLYENEDNIIYPLLYAIKRHYDQWVGESEEVREFKKSFLQVVATSALALTDLGLRVATKHLTGEALKLEDINKQLKAVEENPGGLEGILNKWADNVSELRGAFETLLDVYASEINKNAKDEVRFVILIDDLDRCLPDTAIAILEGIKNHFSGFFKTARFGVEENLTLFSRQTPPIGGKSAEKSCNSVAFATADTCGLNPPSRWFPKSIPNSSKGECPCRLPWAKGSILCFIADNHRYS